ncbi:MAG: response regulator transcription factor [Lachnospiraceae bacterium]|nr:response regulator transcription factor [Lachnospiraceae bacterium]
MANKYRILIIEDEINIVNFIKVKLEANGYQTISANGMRDGIMMLTSHCPDLVILDLGLPDADGMEVIQIIRKHSLLPIIVLSARSGEMDKVQALDQGANDYMTKPFGTEELLARIRSVFRNQILMNSVNKSEQYISGKLSIDFAARQVFMGEEEIHLTRTEFSILALLAKNSGKLLSYDEIIRQVWFLSDDGSIKKLQVNMANIRKKLGETPGANLYIFNELGVGYRME